MIRTLGVVGLYHRRLADVHSRQNQVILEVFTDLLCHEKLPTREGETGRKGNVEG